MFGERSVLREEAEAPAAKSTMVAAKATLNRPKIARSLHISSYFPCFVFVVPETTAQLDIILV